MPRGKNLNPDASKGKRFGDPGGPDPRKVTKNGPPKWSIRQSVKYLSGKSIDEINALGKDNEPTVAQLIAAVALKKALKSEEHTSELQSLRHLVCRLLLRTEDHTSELESPRHLACRLLLVRQVECVE